MTPPWAPRRPCAHHGCGKLVQSGRCDAHRKQRRRMEDTDRPNSYRRGYDKRWARLRRMVLAAQPVCKCGQPATCVDHIVALAAGGDNCVENLEAMCHACHSSKTVNVDGGFGRQRQ